MLFSSTEFMFFFLPLVILFYFLPVFKNSKAKLKVYKNTILLLSSLFFYAWGEPIFVFIMLIYICINYFLVVKMDLSTHKKLFCTLAISLDILLIFYFKYVSFLSENLALFTHNENLFVNIKLPIGISFFVFQMMSYVFDVYYKKAECKKNIFDVALYITLFPQLIAGPIVRFETVCDELKNRSETQQDIADGTIRFIFGLAKKMLLANTLGSVADSIFNGNLFLSTSVAWIGAICYALQIFYDFSGYSDMAIGLGLIFGFHFPENFNFPYAAKSVTDFWRRWHISLSSWFRDYVYIPLGGNRVSRSRWILNMATVWLLTGIWHGANWTFVLWGAFYFILLVTEKLLDIEKTKKFSILQRIITLILITFAWVLFRAESVYQAFNYIKAMLAIKTQIFSRDAINCLFRIKFILPFAIFFALPVSRKFYIKIKNSTYILSKCVILVFTATVFITSLLAIISSTYNPFIYFNF